MIREASVVIWPAVTLHVHDGRVIGAEIDWSSAMGDATDAETGAAVDDAAAVALGEAVDRWLTDRRRAAVLATLAPPVLAPWPAAGRCVAVPSAGQWCGASLVLVERGHEREWRLDYGDDGEVTAVFEGIEDYSEDGDGNYFARCTRCGAEYEPPDEWEWN